MIDEKKLASLESQPAMADAQSVVELIAEVRRLRDLVKDLIDFGPHEDPECPQDDTCTCEIAKEVNETLKGAGT